MENIESMIEKIIVARSKAIDSAIMGEIQEIAIENGIETKIFINERAVANALERATPKPPKEDGWLYCPVCGKDICVEQPNYCSNCGQRIDWDGANG